MPARPNLVAQANADALGFFPAIFKKTTVANLAGDATPAGLEIVQVSAQ